MIRYRVYLVIFLLAGLLAGVLPALAQEDTPLVAVLTLAPLDTYPVGTRPAIQATLLNEEGRPNPNKVLVLYINGERIRQIRTDDLGLASIRINRDLPVGDYQIAVEFAGTEAYLPASAAQTLIIRPIQFTVETVPPLANVSLALDGQTFLTGPDGLGVIEIAKPGTHQLQVLDTDDIPVSEDTRVTFARWADSVFEPDRTIEAYGDMRIQVGFSTSHRVALSYVDLAQKDVSTERVTSITFKRSNGSYYVFEDDEPQWLWATRIVRRKEGLEATPLQYSVESAMVDGTSAVNRYQQRFYVEPNDNWEIQLLLYAVRIHAIDAIFGFRIGKGVTLQYPDGRVHELSFGENRDVYQDSLARGNYQVKVMGVRGIAPLTPIALSRDQDVQLKVLSALDIGAGIGLGLTVALGLLFYKRPRILSPLTRLVPSVRRPAYRPALAYAYAIPAEQFRTLTDTPPITDESYAAVLEGDVAMVSDLDDDRSAEWLMAYFHSDGLKCVRCGNSEGRMIRATLRGRLKGYRCSQCNRHYNLYSGTPFEGSHLTPAQCERLLRGIGQDEARLAHELGLTQRTIRKWQQRLQAAGEYLEVEDQAGRERILFRNADKGPLS